MSTPRTILVVDDDPAVRGVLVSRLKAAPTYNLIEAANGREAIRILANERVHLVITDLQMPEMGGLDLLKHIQDNYADLPAIVITGYATADTAISALRLGAANFIKKPFDLGEVSATVWKVLATYEEVGESQAITAYVEDFSVSTSIPNRLSLLRGLILYCMRHLSVAWGVPLKGLYELNICLYEALLNAYEHGNLGLSYSDKEKLLDDPSKDYTSHLKRLEAMPVCADKRIHFKMRATPGHAEFTVKDEGRGYDFRAIRSLEDDPETAFRSLGRGLMLIKSIMDDVTIKDPGSEITMVKRKPKPVLDGQA